MFKPMTMKFPTSNNLKFWPEKPVLLNGGLNLVDKEWKLPENQTSKVLNMWWYNGELGKRWGQDYLNASEGVETPLYAAYKYLYNGYIIKHCGTKLYKQDPVTGVSTSIYSGLVAQKGSFFKFNNKLYYVQTGKYIQWDGTTASTVVPYIPEVIQNRTPTGGGDVKEQYNRIGAGFINSFNSDGTSTVYTLTDTNLDATPIVASTDYGVTYNKVETTDFTVNRVTGVVTWISAPPAGQNRTKIKAFKTDQTAIDSILNCKYTIPFGGQNDNRVFFGGNGTGYYFWSGISLAGIDATYFPYNNYNIIGNPDENITGFDKQYDTLCIFKPREIYGVTYSWNGTQGIFNTFPINSQVGCDCPDTIQSVDSKLVWCTTYLGPQIMVGTPVPNHRNIFSIGRNINPWLLLESNLTQATSVNFGGKYWLCVNDKVYLWDYFISPYADTGDPEQSAKRLSWWYFDNINAGRWIIDSQNLYYAKRDTGLTVKFHTIYDSSQFYDFGVAIRATYRYPFREMGGGVYEFSVLRGWIDVRGDLKTSFTVTYFTSDDPNEDASTESIYVGSFSLANFSLANFTLSVMGPVYQWELSPYEKNIRYFGAEFTNNDAGRDMNISSIQWQYSIGRMIK